MSPYEHLPTSGPKPQAQSEPDSSFPDHIQSLLNKYDVTTNGFLPEGPPLELLPDEYYAPWEELIRRLPESLDAGTFREEANALPVLQTDRLKTEEEWRRAYVVLCFFAHGYIWGGSRPSEVLPPPISIPLLSVSSHLSLPPIATYASLNLWNFRCVAPPSTSTSLPPSPPLTPASSTPSLPTTAEVKKDLFDPKDLSRLRTLHTFTGTPSESWFYLVSVAMEAQGAYIIPVLLRALHSISLRSPDWKETTAKALRELVTCVEAVGELLERMYEGCEPMVFYHQIRPFLAGSKGMSAVGLPRGVFYDLGPATKEGEGETVKGEKRKGKWMAYRGGSNGQSSLIQFWDIVLGVEHVSHGNSSPHASHPSHPSPSSPQSSTTTTTTTTKETEPPFHQEVRAYMPLPHRHFLSLVSRMGLGKGGIRKAITEMVATAQLESRELTKEEMEVQAAFTEATKALARFRDKHLKIVARYIVIPSRQKVPEEWRSRGEKKDGVVNLASVSSGLHEGYNGEEGGRGKGEDGEGGEMGEKRDGGGKGEEGGKGGGKELTGTGGTALLPFLKQTRDETLKAGEVGR